MDQKRVGFTIDAGLIQRLGYELVGRAETAVSELIKMHMMLMLGMSMFILKILM